MRLTDGISGRLGSKDELRWGDWAGTRFWIDPAEELICIWMIQDGPNSGRTGGFLRILFIRRSSTDDWPDWQEI
ncbi:MAG: hypothetical protein IIB77_08270 [Proteobacteria bacterium]|nr:hypothetical protein [Pseudomonadota bacterium]